MEDFPAAKALVKIGLPGVDAALQEYKIRGKELQFLTWRIIKEVLGDDLGRAYVKNALATEQDPAKKRNLARFVEELSL
jgi:hypothetical protein